MAHNRKVIAPHEYPFCFSFALRLCAIALCSFLCRLCRTLPTLCRFSAITFTTKTPLSSMINTISTTKLPHPGSNLPSSTRNFKLMTENRKVICRFAENKTRQIGNLNTVNKTASQKNIRVMKSQMTMFLLFTFEALPICIRSLFQHNEYTD